MVCVYQDPYVGEGKLDPTEIGPNCCWANRFAQFVGWDIICVLRSNVPMGSFTEFPTLPQKHRYSDSK